MEGSDEERQSCPACCFVCSNVLLKWNCCGCWRGLKQRLYTFITNPFFDYGVVVCLVLNIIFMSMDHFPMTQRFEVMLMDSSLVFTAIFAAEMVLKLVAMDPYGYFQVGWNIFDSIIVVVSLLELVAIEIVGLRCLQLMRMFRLARWWPSFHVLIKIIWASLSALRNLTLLLLIMVFTFAVAGMQLFGKNYKDCSCRIALDCELPRWHMNDFFHAFLVIFRVLCGEWIEAMWDCMEVSGQTSCLIFFMIVLVIGNLLVLNLFLALLLSSFSCDRLTAPEKKEKTNLQIAISHTVGNLLGKKTHVTPERTEVDGKQVNRKDDLALTLVTSGHNMPMKTPENKEEIEKKKSSEIQLHGDEENQKGDTPGDCCSNKCYGCCPFLVVDTSRGGGRVWPNFRRVCFSIVQHKYFEIFIIFIILLSSATLMFEDTHLQQQQLLKEVLERADQVFVLIFLMEMLLKWVAFGFKKYFTDAWCCLDFLILHVFLVSLAADTFGFISFGAFQFLRTFRALGPLRVLSHFQVLRVVVQSLLRSARPLLDVLLVCLLVWCFFSILGVNLFAGKFSGCYNETSEQFFSTEDVNNKTECLILIYDGNYTEVRWKKMLNYDNVASGYLSLMHLGASADSMGIMYSAVDATLIESQPIYEANTYMYLYFVCFMISSFFTYNFLIRVIIDNLQRDKSTGKCIFTTEQQQKYFEAFKKRVMKPEKAVPRPQNWLQARLFDLVTSLYFKVFIVVVICLFMVTMMVSTDEQSEEMDTILQWIHFVCILIFLIELILKVVALRKLYFTDSWNILDFSVLAVSIVGLIIHEVLVKYVYFFPIFSPILFLMLRAVHIFRMLFWSRGIRKLLLGFIMSLPALFNIGLLLFIVMFIFSVFGMFNFAYVQKKGLIDDMFNFETFVNSMICLLMISSTASWDNLLRPIMDTPPDCDPYIQIPGSMIRGDCGSPVLAIIFFVTHIFLCLLLVFNMYIAVILETFNSEDTETLSDHDLQEFYKTWRKFDPESSQFIQYSELSDFCDALQDPLRIPKPNSIKLIHMDLPLQPRDKIHSVDVLLALAAQVLGDSGKRNSLKVRLEEKFTDKPAKCGPISSTLQRKREEVAATVIQRAFRKHILQHGDVGATLQ